MAASPSLSFAPQQFHSIGRYESATPPASLAESVRARAVAGAGLTHSHVPDNVDAAVASKLEGMWGQNWAHTTQSMSRPTPLFAPSESLQKIMSRLQSVIMAHLPDSDRALAKVELEELYIRLCDLHTSLTQQRELAARRSTTISEKKNEIADLKSTIGTLQNQLSERTLMIAKQAEELKQCMRMLKESQSRESRASEQAVVQQKMAQLEAEKRVMEIRKSWEEEEERKRDRFRASVLQEFESERNRLLSEFDMHHHNLLHRVEGVVDGQRRARPTWHGRRPAAPTSFHNAMTMSPTRRPPPALHTTSQPPPAYRDAAPVPHYNAPHTSQHYAAPHAAGTTYGGAAPHAHSHAAAVPALPPAAGQASHHPPHTPYRPRPAVHPVSPVVQATPTAFLPPPPPPPLNPAHGAAHLMHSYGTNMATSGWGGSSGHHHHHHAFPHTTSAHMPPAQPGVSSATPVRATAGGRGAATGHPQPTPLPVATTTSAPCTTGAVTTGTVSASTRAPALASSIPPPPPDVPAFVPGASALRNIQPTSRPAPRRGSDASALASALDAAGATATGGTESFRRSIRQRLGSIVSNHDGVPPPLSMSGLQVEGHESHDGAGVGTGAGSRGGTGAGAGAGAGVSHDGLRASSSTLRHPQQASMSQVELDMRSAALRQSIRELVTSM